MMEVLDWLQRNVAQSAHLCMDSRQVGAGDVFVACPGVTGDGRAYIDAAVRNGAAAVLYEAGQDCPAVAEGSDAHHVPSLAVSGLRSGLGELASAWYGHPSHKLAVIAITGTNGKTSCTQWLAQALTSHGQPCGVIGTLGVRFADGSQLETGLTTPDVVTLHRALARMVGQGAGAVAIEASSIGLEQGRLDGVQIAVAAFTNLTRDHLDAHGTMQAYEQAKARLFAWPGLGASVINLDDAAGIRLAASTPAPVLGYRRSAEPLPESIGSVPVLQAVNVQITADGTLFTLQAPDGIQATLRTAMPGAYNVDNLLLVAGVLSRLGWPLQQIASALGSLQPVPGRLQVVSVPSAVGPMVVVDYAHTPDALSGALAALRPVAQARGGRLVCVFGCGGARDAGKRAPMGAVAQQDADVVFVTSDNPRNEDPQAIIAQVLAGMAGVGPQGLAPGVHVQADRAHAILQSVWAAQPRDVVLLAGKGHETSQEIDGIRYPFADAEWARLALTLPGAAGVSIDSRTVAGGELFVALSGDNFDGHDFLDAVAAAGACAAVTERPVVAKLPVIMLGDARRALLRMAGAWRRRFAMPLIVVTGSNGKTTTKEMIASILAVWHGADRSLATRGNYNNEIGVPLTLLRLRDIHQSAVIELGMNHPGEIAVLAETAAPTIALVNNAQREHQEFMHTVQAVARENGAALQALPADGVAVYPGDEEFSALWDELAGERRRMRFGFGDTLEVTASQVRIETAATRFVLKAPQGSIEVSLPVAGRHNLRNALAAAACTLAAGCPLPAVAAGLNGFQAVKGRLQLQRLGDGTVLIDDTYNANPDSVRAAIDVLAGLPGPRALVLGDMGEVGDNGPAMHREVGAYALERGIEMLFGLGAATRDSVAAFGNGAVHAESPEAIASFLAVAKPAAVLVKGSRFMRMERVVAAFGAQMQNTASKEPGNVA